MNHRDQICRGAIRRPDAQASSACRLRVHGAAPSLAVRPPLFLAYDTPVAVAYGSGGAVDRSDPSHSEPRGKLSSPANQRTQGQTHGCGPRGSSSPAPALGAQLEATLAGPGQGGWFVAEADETNRGAESPTDHERTAQLGDHGGHAALVCRP